MSLTSFRQRAVWLAVLISGILPLKGCVSAMPSEDITKVVEGGTFTRVGDYKIGAGDILQVKVFGEESLSGNFVVAPSGTIQFPLVGFVPVIGLSQVGVGQALERKLSPFVKNARVAVSVNESQSYQVYFSGEVGLKGTRELRARTNLLQGIILAGGPTDRASGRVFLIRRVNDHEIRRYATSYKDLLRGANSLDFLYLERGDIIHVD